jgi:hypothetical protein
MRGTVSSSPSTTTWRPTRAWGRQGYGFSRAAPAEDSRRERTPLRAGSSPGQTLCTAFPGARPSPIPPLPPPTEPPPTAVRADPPPPGSGKPRTFAAAPAENSRRGKVAPPRRLHPGQPFARPFPARDHHSPPSTTPPPTATCVTHRYRATARPPSFAAAPAENSRRQRMPLRAGSPSRDSGVRPSRLMAAALDLPARHAAVGRSSTSDAASYPRSPTREVRGTGRAGRTGTDGPCRCGASGSRSLVRDRDRRGSARRRA